MNPPPSFYKVFIAEICDKDLEIPLLFTEALKESLPEKVWLRDGHGKKLRVGVERIGESWHFVEGWNKFWRENFLTSGDLMVFEYYGKGHFSVLVFGRDTAKKNIVPFTVPRQEQDDEELAPEQVNASGGAGLAQQAENPYFVTKLQKRKGDLFVPMEVIKRFKLEFPKEMKLVDPSGREFQGTCKKWVNGRTLISGGWRRLCQMNLVAEDDKCICELVRDEDNRPRLIKVSFVRCNAIN